ncbi:PREDICTED: telomere repeat-binding protein 3 [Tarenaya hassleriana]|uniref:telomere repeat-binding protein 3 n=1 Tax=Tarenaya hassleriana TaxID=28532 RepID=UPI00053CA090|nr:PREDICTED: telomere repeat-binding protein 3 [Tarenaya hassleriana]XP_010520106.1 PREDICTED: telomere repeat-binding protein 3 [Tarenaya hassleriana]
MVFKRRLDCGSNGFEFSNIPKAPRSCRRKILSKSIDDDDQICAIDLLASLAGKLLQESESSSASTNAFEGDDLNNLGKEIKQEQVDEYKPLKTELPDRGNSGLKSADDITSEKCLLNKFSFCEDFGILDRIAVSDYDMAHDLKPVGYQNKKEDPDFSCKFGGILGEKGDVFVNTGFEGQGEATKRLGDGGLTVADICEPKDTAKLRVPFPESVHSDGDVKSPSCKDPVRNGSFARYGNHTKLGSRDDDENFFRCYKFSNKFNSYRPSTRIGDRRIRKLLSSKYWKAVPKLKDYEHKRADGGLKALYRKRKSCYGYKGWQRDAICKRRRSSDRGSVVTSDGGLSSESVSNSPEKGGSGLLSPVKFSIKSFRIPELFIEVPESTTVGSLKRTVLEAVTALLDGGVRVGVLVQGKKVRDDSKTLSQTGISCEENIGNLGFTLEPGPAKVSTLFCSEDLRLSVPSDSTNLSERSAASPVLDSGNPCPLRDAEDMIHPGNGAENNHELVPYQSEASADESLSDSRALVPVPAVEVEALAIVPVNQKPKCTDFAQRRTRRPFSVGEVEALVQAVEELGTGRWRDVKLRAFENADHRTYVDLKDKWKTLVHTASISPQQRRGEPVPQELLDRVLAAHAYWSKHQVKQQGKHQTGVPKTLENPASDRNRVVGSTVQTGSM